MPYSGETAGASVPQDLPPRESGREPHLHTLFRTAKLLSAAGETLCRVRTLSPDGFTADTCLIPPAGESVALLLCEGRNYSAKIAWAEAERFGARFLVNRPVSDMIGESSGAKHRRRAPRVVPKGGFATLRHAGRSVHASIVNISQTGMAVIAFDTLAPVATRSSLRVEIDGLEPMTGYLRWTAHDSAGIQFERPLSFETLSHWLWADSFATGALRRAL